MGTTSEKLTYLNTTKQKLKDSINALGGDITSETTFRNYATELDNIYSSLPKTTGEGSNLSLNTLKGRINVDNIKGDAEQDSRQGYNLLQAKLPTMTNSGITITNNNDGTFTISGTNTSTSTITFRLDQGGQSYTDNLQNYEDGTYTLDLGMQNENLSITLMQNSTWTNFIVTGFNVRLKSQAITNATNTFIYIGIKGSATLNNVTIKPMFVKGSYTESTMPSFEQYGASPSPSYPQDIEVVRGKNLYNPINVIENALVSANGKITETSECLTIWFKAIPNTTYTLSRNKGDRIVISGTNTQPVLDASTTIIKDVGVSEATTYTFTNGNYEYVAIYISRYTATKPTQIQIEKGSQATSYLPYNTQEVVVSNSSAYNKDFKDLPNTYQAVKYIQSDGNQYFYLNAQWKNTSKIEAIIGTDNEYNNNVIFSESSSASVWIGFSNSTTMSGGGFTNLTITPQATTISYKTLSTITFSYNLTSTGNIRWGTYATITYNKTNRIASLKVYDTDNTLVRNMVACYRKSDNIIGMYDLVNNIFYTNEGSGNFTKGDDLQSQTKTLHLGDIELCKIGTYQDRIFESSGKNIDSSIVESGSLSNGENIAHGECYRSKDYIKVSPNTTYIFSVNNTANRVIISMYNSNKEFISTDGANGYVAENGKFTTYSNCYYIRFRSYGADGQLFNTGNIQIEERKSSYAL